MAPPRKRSKRRPARAPANRVKPAPADAKEPAGGLPADEPRADAATPAPVPAAHADSGSPDGPTLEEVDLAVGAPPEDLGQPTSAPPEDLAVVTGELPPLDGEDELAARPADRARTHAQADRLDEADELLPAARNAKARAPAALGGNRVTSFLRASWAELQRVQWPNRRQVGQATAVVLGFVMIAGGYLALADLLSSNLVDAIL